MRRLPLAPLALIVIVGIWAYLCDAAACRTFARDLGTLLGSAVHGKWDSGAGRTVLGDIGAIAKGTAFRSAHDLHISIGQEPSNHAVVIIKGDVSGGTAEGTGFLVRMPDGPVVFTNYHVIAGLPHFKVLADDGSEIKVTSIRGASDRDIAMLGVAEGQYQYLELEKDVANNLSTGDDVLTPGNSEGGEVTLTTPGKVQGIGPERVEIDNPIYHGNSGGPVINENTGKVVGIVEMATNRAPDDFIDQASRANPNSAIKADVRYFSLRIDTVPRWDTFDMKEVARQSAFIQQFNDDTRSLDSYLNGRAYEKMNLVAKGAPGANYYKQNPIMSKLPDPDTWLFKPVADVLPEFLYAVDDCDKFAHRNMDSIQNPHNFYAFEWLQAQIAADKRQRLTRELDLAKKAMNRLQ